MRVLARMLAIAAMLGGCAAQRWEALDVSSLPAARSYPNQRVLVLLDELHARYFSDPESGEAMFDLTTHERFKILRETESLNHLGVQYDRTFWLLRDVHARVILPDGTVREFNRAQGVDAAAAAFGAGAFFSDVRRLGLDLGSPPVGSVVEWEYTTRLTSARLQTARQSFRRAWPVALARLVVETPRGWEIEVTRRGDGVPATPVVEDHGDVVRRTWEMRDMPGFDDEPLEGLWWPPQAVVRLARWTERGKAQETFHSARDLSAFVARLYGKEAPLEPEMQALVKRVMGETPEPAQRARRLYDWVRDEVKYCDIEVGWGGFKPIPAAEVFRGRYGDCKGKANLLKVLLAAAGIPSRHALVYMHGAEPLPFRLELGMMNNFNHEILIVDLPGGSIVCDPTHPLPFGELILQVQEADLLPVSDPGDDIVRAPGSTEKENATTSLLDVHLSPDGGVNGTIATDVAGAEAPMLDHWLRAVGKKKEGDLLEDTVGFSSNQLEDIEFHGGAGEPLHVSAKLSVGRFASSGGKVLTLRISDMRHSRWIPVLPDEQRRSPIALGPRRTLRETVRIALPDDARVNRMPDPAHVDGPGLRYDLAWKQDGGQLVAERTLVVSEIAVPKDEYPQLREAAERMHAAEARAVVLEVGR